MKNIKNNTRYKLQASSFMKKGTTIVELVIYMGVLAVLLIALIQLFGSALDVRRESESISYSTLDSRYIYNKLLFDIANADSISTPANLGTQSATLTLVKSGVSHTYQLSGTQLLLDGTILNSFGSQVSNVSFLRLGNINGKHTIRLNYTVTGVVVKSSGTQEIKTVTTAVGLR